MGGAAGARDDPQQVDTNLQSMHARTLVAACSAGEELSPGTLESSCCPKPCVSLWECKAQCWCQGTVTEDVWGLPTRSANEKFPELKTMETLPAHEMAVRLCFLFDHYDKHPVCEDLHGCVLMRTYNLLSHIMCRVIPL